MVSYNCSLDMTPPSRLSPTAADRQRVTLWSRQDRLRVDKRHDALDERHRVKVRGSRSRVHALATPNETGWGLSPSTPDGTAFSTRKLHKRLHPCPQGPSDRLNTYEKAIFAGILQSPLTDSNRRPPILEPGQPVATRGNEFGLFSAFPT
jgi:hypothetical protein